MASLCIDIGNSAVSWGVWDGRWSSRGTIPRSELGASLPAEWGGAAPIGIASVRPQDVDPLVARLPAGGTEPRRFLSYRDLPIEVPLEHPEQVGVDRLLNALAWSRTHPGVPAVLVDFGTAITVDRVDREGAFRGGLILPGPALLARSLARETSLLPEIEIVPDPAPWGGDTVTAIGRGITGLLVGGLAHAIDGCVRSLDRNVRVVATGGGAAPWAPLVPGIERIDPHLTIAGVREALGAGES